MRIDQFRLSGVFGEKPAKKAVDNTEAEQPILEQDRIEVSSEGRKYQLQASLKTEVSKQLSEAIAPARLEDIKNSIRNGEYKLDLKETAKRLLE